MAMKIMFGKWSSKRRRFIRIRSLGYSPSSRGRHRGKQEADRGEFWRPNSCSLSSVLDPTEGCKPETGCVLPPRFSHSLSLEDVPRSLPPRSFYTSLSWRWMLSITIDLWPPVSPHLVRQHWVGSQRRKSLWNVARDCTMILVNLK